jgi:hypothetical protein
MAKIDEIEVPLFESGHAGFGHGTEIIPYTYHRTYGSMDARTPTELRPGVEIAQVDFTQLSAAPIFAVEWRYQAGGDEEQGPPIVYWVGDATIFSLQGAATAVVDTGPANITGAMFDDDGSGVPYLYTCFGTANKIERMDISQTMSTPADDIKAGLLMSTNGDAYRTIVPTSGTAHCQISKCPIGSARFTLANWGAGTTVGFAATNINALLSIRDAPIAIKPEGIFSYDPSSDRWINHTRAWEGSQHVDNGKGAYYFNEAIVVPLGRGGAVLFNGSSVKDFDPINPRVLANAQTTQGALSAVGATRYWVVGTTLVSRGHQTPGTGRYGINPNNKLMLRGGSGGSNPYLKHTGDTGATYADASNAIDGDTSTVYTAVIDNGTTDWLAVGHVRPFQAVHVLLDHSALNNNGVTLTLQYLTSSSPEVWTAGASFDFTGPPTTPFAQSGLVGFTIDPINASTPWVPEVLDSTVAYWMRIKFSGAIDNVGIREIRVLPWQPPIDTTNFPLDGLDRSGVYPHVLFGDPTSGVWHDMYQLPQPDDIGFILFAHHGGNTATDYDRLILFGRNGIYSCEPPLSETGPHRTWPRLNTLGLSEFPITHPAKGKLCRFRGVSIGGKSFDGITKAIFYYRTSETEAWSSLNPFTQPPFEGKPRGSPAKSPHFQWALGVVTTNNALTQPSLGPITARFEVFDDPVDKYTQKGVSNPPLG